MGCFYTPKIVKTATISPNSLREQTEALTLEETKPRKEDPPMKHELPAVTFSFDTKNFQVTVEKDLDNPVEVYEVAQKINMSSPGRTIKPQNHYPRSLSTLITTTTSSGKSSTTLKNTKDQIPTARSQVNFTKDGLKTQKS